jgi:CBS domain-containing protein
MPEERDPQDLHEKEGDPGVTPIQDIVVRDIMSDIPDRIPPQMPIDRILHDFSTLKCTDLVVVDGDGKFLGVVSPFDLVNHVNPSMGVRSGKKAPCIECMMRGDALVAEDLMSRSHMTVNEKTPVVEALRLLERYSQPDLVVIDDEGIAIGMLGICGIISHLRLVGHL